MAGTYTKIQLHIIFSTKKRKPYISEEMQGRLYKYLGGLIQGEGGQLYAIGGMPDHVHLLIRWRADRSLSNLMRQVKSVSSGWIHKTFPDKRDFAWQDGYGAFSVSESQSANVKGYIENQPNHHKKMDFKEELLGLLRAHKVDFDKDRIWL